MPRWELLDSESSSKEITDFFEAPNPSTGAYGRVVLYDQKKPQPVVSLASEGLSFTETETEYTKHLTRNGTYTYTLVTGPGGTGPTVTGYVIGFNRERMRGVAGQAPTYSTEASYKVTLTIRRTDK